MRGELTTQQVADYLGVKVQTVYAYVSRGVLAPRRRVPGTGSLFDVAEVQALSGAGGRSRHSRRSRDPSTSDDVRTQITEIGPGSLAYRGRDIRDLVGAGAATGQGGATVPVDDGVPSGEAWTFEEVRDLLTGIPLDRPHGLRRPTARSASTDRTVCVDPAADSALRDLVAALPASTTALDRFKHAVLVAGAADMGRHDRRPGAVALAGARAADAMVSSLTGVPPDTSVAAGLAAYLDLPTDLVDLVLVLLADHDLAVSTTAVRVAVSAGSDLSSALLAGLAAADSPLHVGASALAIDWLRGALRDPGAALDAALVADRPPPGFGHVVYTEQDPRAQLLLARLECDEATRGALELLEEELAVRRGWVLNVDTALALMMHLHDLPRDAGSVLFACGRTAGWTAHAVEELAEPGMRFRLRGVYTGRRGAGAGAAS
ncbi:citrate/2-methylcitrate synthase [Serinicoccus kebangsaanensis]|uniref:citrate/2-methylcitrate synthase n=1 Tax=Serinicoccus kebangsaanensis TaxID=2602069 RepID=UPI00124E7AA8|nr:citrate/2-methylcitrate synthase [Serinicoccus kebangsaanensis]